MRKARIGRLAAIVALSTGLHAALIAAAAFVSPRLEPAGPQPMAAPHVVPVILAPRPAPPPVAVSPPRPPRPRAPRNLTSPAPIAPWVASAPATAPAEPAPAARERLNQAVRARALGCLDLDRLPAELRERCLEQVGAQSREAQTLPPGIALSRRKRTELDALAARRDAERKALERPLAAGVAKYEAPDYSGEPYMTGAGARDPYGPPPPASRRAARKLQRLPP